ncbi:hypothetical protein GA0111570_102413 [Raineyella antarctica]|uniref:Uncharacterized protein n=1 Tax=Raineyella antarctica TaxID=1577474 RepID=A0A1G6GF34_9ACTN|nr:hypothetical protein [Raineyella antarctica]SDB80622.1 hypothetical protein GA0111570_102413 [Raineyella antarctica]
MTDSTESVPMGGTAVLGLVTGEMQPWTDYRGDRRPAGGPALEAWLVDLLGDRTYRHALIVGPHDLGIISRVVERSDRTTLVVRGVQDAQDLVSVLPSTVEVLAGPLDGLASDRADGRWDLVLALAGVERTLSTDSADLSWQAALRLLLDRAEPGSRVVVAADNTFAIGNTLDARPLQRRFGDEEWLPFHDDETRPGSIDSFVTAVRGLGAEVVLTTVGLGPAAQPEVLADTTVVSVPLQEGWLVARAVHAARASGRPLLADPAEAIGAAARSGQLAATADSWFVVAGPALAGAPAVARVVAHVGPYDGSGTVVRAAPADGRWTLLGATEAVPARSLADLVPRPAPEPARMPPGDGQGFEPPEPLLQDLPEPGPVLLGTEPARLADSWPAGPDVATILVRLAARDDVPAFRDLAARIGSAARRQGDASTQVLDLGDLWLDGDQVVGGASPWVRRAPASAAEHLAAAWWTFHDLLVGAQRRHPWPPWMEGRDLVRTWLAMSGVEADARLLDTGRRLADEAASSRRAALVVRPLTVREALADRDRALHDMAELKGHIFGLERTLKFRDASLKSREETIRRLRGENVEWRSSRLFRTGRAVRSTLRAAGLGGVLRRGIKVGGMIKRRLRRS